MPFELLSPEMAICFSTLLLLIWFLAWRALVQPLIATPVLAMYLFAVKYDCSNFGVN